MKIVLDARFYGSKDSGLGIYTENLIGNLVKLFPQDEFIALLRKRRMDDCEIEAPNFRKVEVDIPHYSFAEQFKLSKIIDSFGADFVHFLNFNKPIHYRKPNIITFYDLTLLKFNGKKGGVRQKLGLLKAGFVVNIALGMRTATKILSISDDAKEELIKKFKIKRNKVRTILLGFDKDDFSSKKKESDKKICEKYGIKKDFVFYIGNDRPHKNLIGLVQAWRSLPKDLRENHQLILGGNISKDGEVANYIRENNLDNIKLIGFIDDEDKSVLFRSAKVFAFPSFNEGFGLPILEAMASGTVTISSNAASLPEAGGDAALYFDPADVGEISEKLQLSLSDENLRKVLREKGVAQAEKFSWEKVVKETHEEYVKLFEKIKKD